MVAAKATTTRTRKSATVNAKAETEAAAVDAGAVIDLDLVRKPLYAYVGVADLAVEKLRTLPDAYKTGVNSAVSSAQSQVNQARGSVKTVKALPIVVRGQLSALPNKAKGTYGDLVERGQKLVTTVRSNPNAKAAADQLKTAKSQAKGATTSVRRSAGAAADHAKTAKSQAKGAATSVRRSAKSAEKVVEATAEEIG